MDCDALQPFGADIWVAIPGQPRGCDSRARLRGVRSREARRRQLGCRLFGYRIVMTLTERAMEIVVRGHDEPPGREPREGLFDHRPRDFGADRRDGSSVGSLMGARSVFRRERATVRVYDRLADWRPRRYCLQTCRTSPPRRSRGCRRGCRQNGCRRGRETPARSRAVGPSHLAGLAEETLEVTLVGDRGTAKDGDERGKPPSGVNRPNLISVGRIRLGGGLVPAQGGIPAPHLRS